MTLMVNVTVSARYIWKRNRNSPRAEQSAHRVKAGRTEENLLKWNGEFSKKNEYSGSGDWIGNSDNETGNTNSGHLVPCVECGLKEINPVSATRMFCGGGGGGVISLKPDSMAATSHTWLLNIGNLASAMEQLSFKFCLILINFNLSNHIQMMAFVFCSKISRWFSE